MGLFDHAIVYVPGTPSLWIDPTNEFTRVGQLPVPDQGRLALITGFNSTELVRTPELPLRDNRIIETREVFLAEEGKGRVVETTEWTGTVELGPRQLYDQANEAQILEQLLSYAKQTYVTEGVANVEHSDPHDLSGPFQVRFEATDIDLASTESGEAAVAIVITPLIEQLTQILQLQELLAEEKRSRDLVLPEAFVHEWRYRIVPPPGFRPRPLPESGVDRLGPATLSKEFTVLEEGRIVAATLQFDPGKRRLTPYEVETLRSSVEEILNSQLILVTFEQIGEAHLAAGRIGEALREFRELAALHPEEALHRTQVARALLEGGMGEAARNALHRTIALDPISAVPHRTLGWILQHDLVGRRFKKGSDLEAAVAAYRKALELDPSDSVARADLAILLEHDADGNRYGPKARLDEAIEEYRALQEELDSSNPLSNNLPTALMWARRFEELKEFIRRQDSSLHGNPLVLVAVAATDGSNAALKEDARLFRYDESRSQALLAAGGALTQLRLYPEAAALLTAGARGTPNAAAILGQASLIGKVRRHEDLSYPQTDPRSVVKQMFIALFLHTTGDEFVSLLAREQRESTLRDKALEGFQKKMRPLRSGLQTLGVAPEVLVDIILAGITAVRLKVE